MRIVEIIVTGLFGIFDHKIPLNVEDGITIIHGPNGFGKTNLLKMLNGLFSSRYSELINLPFQKFQVNFEDGSCVWVDKTPLPKQTIAFADIATGVKNNGASPPITVNFSKANATDIQSFPLNISAKKSVIPLSMLEEQLPVERVGRNEWLAYLEGKTMTLDETLLHFVYLLPPEFRMVPDWWIEFQNTVGINLIGTERLLDIPETNYESNYPGTKPLTMVPVVEVYSEDLVKIITTKLAESVALSQSLDRTFPTRLIEQMGQIKLTQAELRTKLDELETERARLREVGLLDREEDLEFLPAKEVDGNTKDALAIYVQDVDKKLSVFDDLATKIELFREIINKRFLYNKMAISKQTGFTFTLDNKPLPATALSLGEQHELVLLYQLLFKVPSNALILIDEPELSLHVAWQTQFLRDLQEITKLASFDVLIATHSPQIIHDRWDLTVELKGPKTL